MDEYLVIIRGPGGVGKSTVGYKLEERIENASHIDVDEYKVRTDSELSMEERRALGRAAANKVFRDVLKEGNPVIISECFVDMVYLKQVKQLAKDLGYVPQSFYIDAEVDVCIDRNLRRGKNMPLDHIRRRYMESEPLKADTVVHNVEGKLEVTIQTILDILYPKAPSQLESDRIVG